MGETEVQPTNGEPKEVVDQDLEDCIVRQIEYYFGDINLGRDKFLKEQILIDDGWVPYTTMLKFKRLAALTTDTEAITAALKKSQNQLMEVSEDGAKIRRSPDVPLPELNEDRRKELMTRTIYAKGFPKEDTTLDDCLKFFRTFNDPENVIMRRYLDKATKTHCFKGSVFVTFKTKEDAEKFLAEESVKYKEVELIKKWQSVYIEEKQAENEVRYKKQMEKKKTKENKEKSNEKPGIVLPRGTVLILSEVPEEMNRDSIKEVITGLEGEVGFIKIDEKKAWVRLQKEGTAKQVFEKMTDSKVVVNNIELTCEIPSEEVEKEFLDQMAAELKERQSKMSKFKGGNRNFGRKRKGAGDGGPRSKRR